MSGPTRSDRELDGLLRAMVVVPPMPPLVRPAAARRAAPRVLWGSILAGLLTTTATLLYPQLDAALTARLLEFTLRTIGRADTVALVVAAGSTGFGLVVARLAGRDHRMAKG